MTLAEAIAAGDLLATARAYVRAGLSVIPVHADGTKAPKQSAWTQWAERLPSEVQLQDWFGRARGGGIGIPGGPASGNLSVLDFETAEVWDQFLARLSAEERAHADRCPMARTPGGGAHLYVRLELSTRGVTLAERPNGVDDKGRPRVKTLIETRAHGEQVLAPGCPVECHPLNLPYTWERMAWVAGGESYEVPLETWMAWLEHAVALTQVERKRAEPRADTRDLRAATADDPGTDFNWRGTWEAAGLFDGGAEWVTTYGDDKGTVRRPGKSAGVSGTAGVCVSKKGGHPLFHCFTPNWAPFEKGGNYDRFGVFARVRHGGDFKAASKALRDLGFGKQDRPEPAVTWTRTAPTTEGPVSGRGFKWASELLAPEQAEDWIWHGYLPRGAVALLSALWKVGKTTLLSHLLRACGAGGEFLGRPIKACKVLYVSEEGERHWVRRRDSLGLTDNVGFYLQPFGARPNAATWGEFVKQLAADVATHGFDLVVFDTLAKLWPVQDENGAGEVDAALMPLWDVTKAGAGVLLIHHLRKSGGSEYTGSRGSGALSAFADILIELTRFDAADPKDKKRVLRAKGRYEETPDELVIELVNGDYVAVQPPDGEAAGADEPKPVFAAPVEQALPKADPTSEGEAAVVRVLTEGPEAWMQADEIKAGLRVIGSGMRDGDVSDYLNGLYFKRQVLMRGTLRSKSSPRQFALAARVASHAAPSAVGMTSGHEMGESDGNISCPTSHAHSTQGRHETISETDAA